MFTVADVFVVRLTSGGERISVFKLIRGGIVSFFLIIFIFKFKTHLGYLS